MRSTLTLAVVLATLIVFISGCGSVVSPGTETYKISGNVSTGGGPLAGVQVTADCFCPNIDPFSDTSNVSGDYEITGLPIDTYAVIPERAGYTFIPLSRLVTVDGTQPEVTGQNFTGQIIP